LEPAIAVITLGDPKRVFPSKVGFETIVGNAATTVTTSALRLLSRLSLLFGVLLLLRTFLSGLGVVVLLLCAFLFRRCGFIWLRFFRVLFRLVLLFLLLVVLLLLCARRSRKLLGSKTKPLCRSILLVS
jgi:hypothetical protein